jgi:hypothetical protein
MFLAKAMASRRRDVNAILPGLARPAARPCAHRSKNRRAPVNDRDEALLDAIAYQARRAYATQQLAASQAARQLCM